MPECDPLTDVQLTTSLTGSGSGGSAAGASVEAAAVGAGTDPPGAETAGALPVAAGARPAPPLAPQPATNTASASSPTPARRPPRHRAFPAARPLAHIASTSLQSPPAAPHSARSTASRRPPAHRPQYTAPRSYQETPLPRRPRDQSFTVYNKPRTATRGGRHDPMKTLVVDMLERIQR